MLPKDRNKKFLTTDFTDATDEEFLSVPSVKSVVGFALAF
jgi:hypothetical protein